MAINKRGDVEIKTNRFIFPNQIIAMVSDALGIKPETIWIETQDDTLDNDEICLEPVWRGSNCDVIGVVFTLSPDGTQIYVNDCGANPPLDMQAVDRSMRNALGLA